MSLKAPSVKQIAIEKEMRSSFMDYAMSVIISRALPDARDGLKPVHRRILFAQDDLSNYYNRPFLKCARIVGDVIGKYHPHGDAAVYRALVRMAQDFSTRYLLISGQGNFGSMDGDPPAAMRYTECRMSRLSSELLADLDKQTVDWKPNYDDKEREPVVLPTKVPNLLINGSSGIAVGMATKIPPHNLNEIIDATLAIMKNPSIDDATLLSIVPGPDFPTRGIILGQNGIARAYKTGRGTLIMRGRADFENTTKDRQCIVVSEMPYMVNKATWIEESAALVRDKRLEGISDIRDESNRDGVRVVFELKRDAHAEIVLNSLYNITKLQTSFSINMLAIVGGKPKLLSLREAIEVFIDHRRTVIVRRSQFELNQAQQQQELIEGLILAVLHIDRVIEIIKTSSNTNQASQRLVQEKMTGMSQFLKRAGRPQDEVDKVSEQDFVFLTPRQAKAVLDMRLGKLTGLEREKLESEYKALWVKIDNLNTLLSNDEKLTTTIVEELTVIREQFGDERRTEISHEEGQIDTEDLITSEDMIITTTHLSYVKCTKMSEYKQQGRGGRGIYGTGTTTESDFVSDMLVANTHDSLLMFTNQGRIYSKKTYQLPSGTRTGRGKPIANIIDLQENEKVLCMLPIQSFTGDHSIIMATQKGIVKKTSLEHFKNIRTSGIRAINLDDDDTLIAIRLTNGSMDILLATRQGFANRFCETKVRPTGRTSRGVKGIRLSNDDTVIGMSVFSKDSKQFLLTSCEHGYGKRTPLNQYSAKNRGTRGVINIKTTERNGQVSSIRIIDNNDHVFFVSNRGKVIRLAAKDIQITGRSTQGSRLMRLNDDEIITSLAGTTMLDQNMDAPVDAPIESNDAETQESTPLPDDLETNKTN